MKGLKSIQNLPEQQRKIILWVIMILVGLGLFTVYTKNAREKIKTLNVKEFKEEIQLPSLEEELRKLPKLEIPSIPQENTL